MIIIKIEVIIDQSYTEPKITLMTASITAETERIIKRLSEDIPQMITAYKNGKIEILEPEDLIRIYANSGKIFAVTVNGEYVLKLRLYEAEELLPSNQFIGISNSEIINLKKVKNFDLSFTGTICVRLSDGVITFVSRRFVPKLKKVLGI